MTQLEPPSAAASSHAASTGAECYDGYRAWKQWNDLFTPKDYECALFQREFRGLPLPGKRLLDIGFGSGALLAWAQRSGASIAGIELQPELREAAEARGIRTYEGLDHVPAGSYDIITAFDVLEHIPREHLVDFLKQVRRIADRDARIVFRFPNCQSAAGLLNQFGDATHVSMLSGPIVAQLCRQAGLDAVVLREAADPAFPAPFAARLLRPFQRLLRQLHRLLLRVLYSSGSTPLSTNVLVVVKPAD